jgi:hypothetical protein
MATAAWIVLCKQAPDLTAANMNQQCPQASRVQFQTTLEALTSSVATTTAVTCTPVAGGVTTTSAPFDYAYAGSIWTMAFTFVVGLYLVTKKAGLVLDFIRRA